MLGILMQCILLKSFPKTTDNESEKVLSTSLTDIKKKNKILIPYLTNINDLPHAFSVGSSFCNFLQ